MRYSRFEVLLGVLALAVGLACIPLLSQTQEAKSPAKSSTEKAAPAKAKPAAPAITGIGTTPNEEDMGNLAWVSGPSGHDLPEGSGTAAQGEPIFESKCSMCHGPAGQGVHWKSEAMSPVAGPMLIGPRAMATNNPPPRDPWIPPIVNGAPFPEVIFNTIAVEMPMFRPGTLKPDEIYSLVAFIFAKNGLIKEDQVMNKDTMREIKMPNGIYFPKSDAVYQDMKLRGCYKTHGVCLDD